MRYLFVGAVLVEIVFDLLAVGAAIWRGDYVALPGALARALLIGTLGAYSLLRGARWARITFAGVEYVTASGSLVLGIASAGQGQLVDPVALAIFVGFVSIGVLATIGKGHREMESAVREAIPPA